MADKNNNERKQKRIAKRDAKLDKYVTSEAKELGVDLNAPKIGPLGAKEKAEIDTRMSNYAKEDQREGLARLQKRYKNPEIETPTKPNKEDLKKQYKKQRRAKLWDILGAVAGGLAGESADPSQFRFTQLKNERQNQLKQFKSASKASREKLAEWGEGYAQDQIDYLEGLKDKENSDLKKKKIEAEIEKIKVETKWQKNKPYYKPSKSSKDKVLYTHQNEDGNWKMTNKKNPYSDLYYKLTGNSQSIINELAKQSGMPSDPKTGKLKSALSTYDVERLSNTLLSKAFDIRVDADGNQIAIPKPGKQDFLANLNSSISNLSRLKSERARLESEREDKLYEVADNWTDTDKNRINAEYDRLLSKNKEEMAQFKNELDSMLNGESNSSNKEPSTQSVPKTKLDEIYGL